MRLFGKKVEEEQMSVEQNINATIYNSLNTLLDYLDIETAQGNIKWIPCDDINQEKITPDMFDRIEFFTKIKNRFYIKLLRYNASSIIINDITYPVLSQSELHKKIMKLKDTVYYSMFGIDRIDTYLTNLTNTVNFIVQR